MGTMHSPRLHTKRHMMSPPSNTMSFSMENPMNNWNEKYHMPLEFTAYFLSEQDFIDHMFIWLIYSTFGILVPVEELLVTA